MKKDTINTEHLSINSRDVLTEVLRRGVQEMLTTAIENEVLEYVAGHPHLRDAEGWRLVVCNGYLPQRTIQTGIGPVDVQQPRVNDRRLDQNDQRIRVRLQQK